MLSADFNAVLAAVRAGDRAALDRMVTSLYPPVRALVHSSLETDLRRKRPWLTAMFSTGDVVQEVFLSVVRDLEDFQGTHEGAFVNYLATLVKNRLIDAVRFHEAMRRDVRRSSERVGEQEEAPPGAGPVDLVEREEQLRAYARAIAMFPQREQLLLRERLHGTQTFKELAEMLGYPSEDAARKAFHAAQARLLLRLRAADASGDRTP